MILLIALLLVSGSAEADRVRGLERKLMAPCCYQTTLAEHHSEAAKEMKTEIAALVSAGKSDGEIVELYKERYGPRILAEPEGAAGVWLRALPVVVLLVGFGAVVLVIRRWRASASASGGV